MAIIREDTKGKIRDLPIHDTLRTVLTKAANAVDIAVVRVTSGGQCHKGTCTKRTGSTRHDGGYAADLQLLVDGQRALDFTKPDDLAVVSAFVTAAAALGATGSGAAVDYTGSTTLHVGFGTSPKDRSRLVWGAGGASAHAPGWLQKAAQKGWHSPKIAAAQEVEPAIGPFVVAARDGLNLRGAPRFEAPILSVLDAGAVVTVFAFDGVLGDWARIDVQGDGLFDGHVHRAFLKPIGPLQ
ncbi:SH3 domain-containing protein [Methylobacterium sp. 37f]|uniref:SH3 domain-containing protein n=1 Tax=Methylobacterium sp. 37f TaxID=2817058 RepID=UPI001FFCED0C|nr:SH3 domain-containing protein [Methylobacterium sp. 37f]